MKPILLIDADLVAFRCAATAELDPLYVCNRRIDEMMRGILGAFRAKEYFAFLTGSGNFRKEVDPLYKANRKDKVPPVHLQDAREYLVVKYGAQVTDGIEADDALGIHQDKENNTTVICSIDKDLKQIPGRHYNFVKDEAFEVTKEDGLRFFYKQLLIGDTSDNIIGVRGIGPKKSDKLLDNLNTEEEWYLTTRNLYQDDERYHRNGKLLWIMKHENDIWEPSQSLLEYYQTNNNKNKENGNDRTDSSNGSGDTTSLNV